jgi:hypothetical protein
MELSTISSLLIVEACFKTQIEGKGQTAVNASIVTYLDELAMKRSFGFWIPEIGWTLSMGTYPPVEKRR